MTVDERIESLLTAERSREANLGRAEKTHKLFITRAEKTLQSMARIQHRLTKFEGGAQ